MVYFYYKKILSNYVLENKNRGTIQIKMIRMDMPMTMRVVIYIITLLQKMAIELNQLKRQI